MSTAEQSLFDAIRSSGNSSLNFEMTSFGISSFGHIYLLTAPYITSLIDGNWFNQQGLTVDS